MTLLIAFILIAIYLIGGIGPFIASVLGNLVAADLWARAPSLADRLVEKGAFKLPMDERDRFREDCHIQLNNLPSHLSKFCHAFGCYLLSVSPKWNLVRVSQWRALRKKDPSICKGIDNLFQFGAMSFACGIMTFASVRLIDEWKASLLIFGMTLLSGGLCRAQWNNWQDMLVPLLTGKATITDLPDCRGVSADLVKRAQNGELQAQTRLGETYRVAAVAEQGLDRLLHFCAAEVWLRKAAERGDLFAQKSLARHLHLCRENEEAEKWDRVLAEGEHPA